MRIAKWAKHRNIPTHYYISPQIWAWKAKRIHVIAQNVDHMAVILPFEKAFYKKHNYEVEYVGHPLVSVIDNFIQKNKSESSPWHQQQLIALLPGSRKQEIAKKLPVMLEVAPYFPDYTFIVGKAPGIENDFYNQWIKDTSNVKAVSGKTYDLLLHAKAALVTSGTATLETALFGVPQIICYKGSNISYQIAKRLVSIKFIGLANLIMNKEVVKELIQEQLTIANLRKELELLLSDSERKRQVMQDYADLKKILQLHGNASENAAEAICRVTGLTSSKTV